MRFFLYIWILIELVPHRVDAQIADTAIVTGIKQEIKLYAAWRSVLSEESFPDYFTADSTLQQSLLNTTRHLVQQKFGAQQLLFEKGQKIDYIISRGPFMPDLQNNQLQRGDIFLSIRNSIALTTISTSEAG